MPHKEEAAQTTYKEVKAMRVGDMAFFPCFGALKPFQVAKIAPPKEGSQQVTLHLTPLSGGKQVFMVILQLPQEQQVKIYTP